MYQPIRNSFLQFVPSLTTEELDRICLRLQYKKLNRNEVLLAQGAPSEYVYFINTGALSIFSERDGMPVSVFYVFEQQWISEYAGFVSQTPSASTIQAIEPSEVLMLHYNDVQYSYNNNPKFERFGRLIAEYIIENSMRADNERRLYSPLERYLKLIERGSPLLQRLNQRQIAAYLGIQPESFSRIRKRLSKKS